MTEKICSLKIPRLLGVHMQEENTYHSQLLAWVFFMKIAVLYDLQCKVGLLHFDK